MITIPTDPIWVDTDAELVRLCDLWSGQAAVAVDTEFMRSQTFYPIAGLLQVGDGKGCYLIDPTTIKDFTPLKALLLNSQVTKVLHSCSEDLEVFSHLFELVPEPLFDTQIAAAFAGYGFSVGYANLLKAALGIDIPKSETRSDWLQRPLSASQMKYAALDVAYLLVVYGKLLQTLRATGRLPWVLEDCREWVEGARQAEPTENYYGKVKLAWKLNRQELAILQVLCDWREQQARARDTPRNRLIKEQVLWELARRKPRKEAHLYAIQGLLSRTVKTQGQELLQLVADVLERDQASYPELMPPPLSPEQGDLLKVLKSRAREKAEAIGIPVEVLIRKKDFEFIVRSGTQAAGEFQLPERLKGWRKPVIGDELIRVAKETSAQSW